MQERDITAQDIKHSQRLTESTGRALAHWPPSFEGERRAAIDHIRNPQQVDTRTNAQKKAEYKYRQMQRRAHEAKMQREKAAATSAARAELNERLRAAAERGRAKTSPTA